MKIICISDSHTKHNDIKNIPNGDVIIHSGDVTEYGTYEELEDFISWFAKLPHKYKIFIAGNHDLCLEKPSEIIENLPNNMYYLGNSKLEINGFKLWGTPISFAIKGMAFFKNNIDDIVTEFNKIPLATDILITHIPAKGVLDDNYGCEALTKRIEIVKPLLHICGHIHSAYGKIEKDNIISVNACLVKVKEALDAEHKIVNKPIEVVLN